MILQLNPPVPLQTPKGAGLAWFLIDYGVEHHLMWTVAINETGEIWTFANPEVRAEKNITMQAIREKKEHIQKPPCLNALLTDLTDILNNNYIGFRAQDIEVDKDRKRVYTFHLYEKTTHKEMLPEWLEDKEDCLLALSRLEENGNTLSLEQVRTELGLEA